MKKAELLAAIAEKNGSTKKNAEAALDAVISTITEALEVYQPCNQAAHRCTR